MRGERLIVGVFSYLDQALAAVRAAQAAKIDYKVYSPVPAHELEQVTSPEKSPVRFITFIGAVAGCIFGFLLTILCSLDWPLRVSAKDAVSPPAFAVIAYECTILFGAIATLMAVFHFCRIPWVLRSPGYDPRFSQDKFGVVLGCAKSEVSNWRAALEQVGAEEVQEREGL